MSNETDKNFDLADDVKTLIIEGRKQVALSVNAAMTLLYWQVGYRIHQEILQQGRAAYGEQVIADLSAQLTQVFGKGWSKR